MIESVNFLNGLVVFRDERESILQALLIHQLAILLFRELIESMICKMWKISKRKQTSLRKESSLVLALDYLLDVLC